MTLENEKLHISVATVGAELSSIFCKEKKQEFLWQGELGMVAATGRLSCFQSWANSIKIHFCITARSTYYHNMDSHVTMSSLSKRNQKVLSLSCYLLQWHFVQCFLLIFNLGSLTHSLIQRLRSNMK